MKRSIGFWGFLFITKENVNILFVFFTHHRRKCKYTLGKLNMVKNMAMHQRKRKSTALKPSMNVFFFPTVWHNIQPEGMSYLYFLSTAQLYSAYKSLGRNYYRETPQSPSAYHMAFWSAKGAFPNITQHKPSDTDLMAQAPAAAARESRIWAGHMLLYTPRHNITPLQLSYIKKTHILCHSEEK